MNNMLILALRLSFSQVIKSTYKGGARPESFPFVPGAWDADALAPITPSPATAAPPPPRKSAAEGEVGALAGSNAGKKKPSLLDEILAGRRDVTALDDSTGSGGGSGGVLHSEPLGSGELRELRTTKAGGGGGGTAVRRGFLEGCGGKLYANDDGTYGRHSPARLPLALRPAKPWRYGPVRILQAPTAEALERLTTGLATEI
jgi:hypothetical protein